MLTGRQRLGEFCPLELWRGELADLLVILPDTNTVAMRSLILAAEETNEPATCNLVTFPAIMGLVVDWEVLEAQAHHGFAILVSDARIKLWIRVLAAEQ